MEAKEYGEKLCDCCEKNTVKLFIDIRPFRDPKWLECLAENIIPADLAVYFGKIMALEGGKIVALYLLGISVVLCEECSRTIEEETLSLMCMKQRILKEAIREKEISIKHLEKDIKEKKVKKESLIQEIDGVNKEILSYEGYLFNTRKTKEEVGECLSRLLRT